MSVRNDKFHSQLILSLTLWTLLPLLFNQNFYWWGPLVLATLSLFLYAGMRINAFLKIIIAVFMLSSSVFILNLLYPATEQSHHQILDLALNNFIRLFFLTLISVSASTVIDLEQLILSWASSKKGRASWQGKVRVAYVLLAAINAMTQLREESERILIVMRFRGISRFKRFYMLFPLLVYAIKYSQRVALALIARGIDEDKSFFFNYIPIKDEQIAIRRINYFLLFYSLGWFVCPNTLLAGTINLCQY
ncbi:MAG: hypothetical protein HQK53_00630 [Oligoflexia bacterium]|nr:hypothetical protein [Oligoflexia bacterium]